MADLWAEERTAVRNAPSKPYMTDEWDPTDERLWLRVLMVAKGRKRQMTRVGPNGPRTIHAPNHGRGFRHWPNQKAVAWAVKQYNGYGGRWKGKDEKGEEVTTKAASAYEQSALEQMRRGSILTTQSGTADHRTMLSMEQRDLVQLVEASNTRLEFYWDITYQGMRHVTASLGGELTRKMEALLTGPYDLNEARKLAAWFEATFSFRSGRTPRGQKDLKDKADKLWWFLAHGNENAKFTVEPVWRESILPRLGDLTKFFSSEGGVEVPQKLVIGSNTYLNRAGLNSQTLEKYARRLEQVWSGVTGWRARAFVGGLTVAFVSAKEFPGKATGKYKSDQDEMRIRTTPAVLKRGDGYAGFDYILTHELGHRYEYKVRVDRDFDLPEWWTSKYSRQEGEAFAELFAIGHYNMKGSWDPAVLDRFEKVMS